MPWLEVSGFFLAVIAGVLTARLLKPGKTTWLRAFSSCVGAYLMTLVLLHIIPELFHTDIHEQARRAIGAWILVGFFAQVVLEWWSTGIEHGHGRDFHGRLPMGVLIGLCLHAFTEALGLGRPEEHFDPTTRQLLLLSILLHKYPVTVAFAGAVFLSPMKQRHRWLWILIFTFMAPLGLLCGMYTPLNRYTRQLSALVVGIFMHIGTTVLFESGEDHHFDPVKFAGIVIGIGLGLLTILVHR